MICVTCNKKLKIARDVRKHLGHSMREDKNLMGVAMKTKKHDENCMEINKGFGKNEGFTCFCGATKPQPHTPTPWNYDMSGNILSSKPVQCVATVHLQGLATTTEVLPQDANAAFIVRAVNAYEELLKACVLMLGCIRQEKDPFYREGEDQGIVTVTDTILMEKAWTAAKQAIARAEEGK